MALTKISRGLLDTGVSDSSDATAITINSSEQVAIGITTPTADLTLASRNYSDSGAGSASGMRFTGGAKSTADAILQSIRVGNDGAHMFMGANCYVGTAGGAVQFDSTENSTYVDCNAYAGAVVIGTSAAGSNPTERMRITTAGQLAIGNTGYGTGVLAYDRDIGAPNWGMNITENSTYNDNNGHTFSSKQNTHGVIYIKDEGNNNGFSAIPFHPNGGGGVGYAWTALDPDAGSFTTGTVTFTMAGNSNLAFTVSMAAGSGTITITRTGGSQLYRVVIMEFAQL